MVRKVYVCGVHSSGKTTLLNSVKKKLAFLNEKVIFCEELARRVILQYRITPEMQRDAEFFKKLNLFILKEQANEENKIEIYSKTQEKTLCFFDRGIIDPIIYLQMEIGYDFAQNALQLPHVSAIVENLRKEDECLVFITKPWRDYYENDGLRLDTFDFKKSMKYDEAIQAKMKNLHIPFIYIKEKSLTERTQLILTEIFRKWSDM